MESADIRASFGGAVRQRRRQMRLSQEELAQRAGLHRTYVSDIERGRRNVSLDNIHKLAQALETSVGGLFEQPAEAHGEGPRPPETMTSAARDRGETHAA